MQTNSNHKPRNSRADHEVFPVSFVISCAVVQSAHIEKNHVMAVTGVLPFLETKGLSPKNHTARIAGGMNNIIPIAINMPFPVISFVTPT